MRSLTDTKGFQQFLKRLGEKDHVIDRLTRQGRECEAYLAGTERIELAAAG